MARTHLKADTDIEITRAMVLNALTALDVDFSHSDKEVVMRCCFHHDDGRRPHLYVNIKDKPGVAHCFWCEKRSDFRGVVQALTGWNPFQVNKFCRKLSKMVEWDEPEQPKMPLQNADDPLAPYAFRHPYLTQDRGLSEETQQRFSIGYDKAKQAIVFPWFDRNGKLVAIKKRRVIDKGFDYEKGANTSRTLFGLHLVRAGSYLWITEGEIDAMTLDQTFRLAHFDKHYALALGGSSLRESQLEAVLEKKPEAIVLMLDNDDVGREAQIEAKKLMIRKVRVLEASYPDGTKDANELSFEQIVQITHNIEKQEVK